MPLNPFSKCFWTAIPQKKHHFSPTNGHKMHILGPNQCSLGPSGQFVPLLPYFEGARRYVATMCCMPLHPFYNCFTAASPKIHLPSPKKRPNMPIWVRVVSLCPWYPILRMLDTTQCVASNSTHLASVSGPSPQKKTPFSPENGHKCEFLPKISVFWVQVVRLCPPLPHFGVA